MACTSLKLDVPSTLFLSVSLIHVTVSESLFESSLDIHLSFVLRRSPWDTLERFKSWTIVLSGVAF